LYAEGELFRQAAFLGERRAELLQKALNLRDLATTSKPTTTHEWLVSLGPCLRRCYTQNIDMLEGRAGMNVGLDEESNCVPLHGSLANIECDRCHAVYEWDAYRDDINRRQELVCLNCLEMCKDREARGKRQWGTGQLQPTIIMLDTVEHPDGDTIGELIQKDSAQQIDILLILGTSLSPKLKGPRDLVRNLARRTQEGGGKVIYVNLTEPRSEWNGYFDYWVEWYCDEWVSDLLERQSIWEKVERQERGSTLENPIVID
jgi:NAD-dependent histone deacetylase SIR2